MSYQTFEESVHAGAPIEGYKFIGSFATYRYTSTDAPVTINGELYEPIVIKRRPIKTGTQSDSRLDLEIEIPADLRMVQDYAYATSPPDLDLEVYRVHRGTDYDVDYYIIWSGKISAFRVEDRLAKILVPSTFTRALQGDIPSAYYQNPCNHVLYDGRCRANKFVNTQTTTVADLPSPGQIQVADDGFADAYLKAGEILNNRNGERRMILDNQVNLITINFPFVDLLIGDSVDLVAGCDHSFTTCGSKFNNAVNYGGHPYVPADNPFTVDSL